MIGEQVIWTALPKGFDEEGRLVVSVHVAPRLVDDASNDPHKLGEFPARRLAGASRPGSVGRS